MCNLSLVQIVEKGGVSLDGALLGDIAGSRYEFSKPKGFNHKKISLFENGCFYTDDTVMTVATKYAILNKISYRDAYVLFGKRYPYAGYGPMFKEWICDHLHSPYQSHGNGSAMRVSFVGEYFNTLEEVELEAKKSAECSHNHPRGIAGAQAVAVSVFLARNGFSKREIKKQISSRYGYSLNRRLFLYRPFSKFDMSCEGSVPLAIRCFMESDSWESSIRNVLSITCDTDTVACITGAIAEAYYKDTGFENDQLLHKFLYDPAVSESEQLLYRWATEPYCKEDRE